MKSVIGIISDGSLSNSSLVEKLNKHINAAGENHKEMMKITEIEERILRENVPKTIDVEIKESRFANSLEYKKYLIRQYLKKNPEDLYQSQKEELKDVECIKHLESFLNLEQQKKTKEKIIYKILEDIGQMEKQYLFLKENLSGNPWLVGQILLKYNKAKSDITQSLKNLMKRQKNAMITIWIKDIKECIPKVKDVTVFNYWMFTIFQELVQFNGIDKTLKLHSLNLFQGSKVNENSFYRLDIQTKTLNFKRDEGGEINRFLEIMEKTFKLVKQIQKQIKDKIEETANSQTDSAEKERQKEILSEVEKQEDNYKKRIGDDIFPTIYLFDFEHRKKLFKIFDIEAAADIDSMPSLLLSYRYSVESRQTEAKFTQIAKRISQKLAAGGQKEFEQVCFFLQINTKIIKNREATKSLQGADFALNLVRILINECIDKIQYSKIEKLLKLQELIREFKNSITY